MEINGNGKDMSHLLPTYAQQQDNNNKTPRNLTFFRDAFPKGVIQN